MRGYDICASMQHLTVTASKWQLGCPIVVLHSDSDKVWPLPLPQRWADLIKGTSSNYKEIELKKVSHFRLMDHALVRKEVLTEIAAAARAGVGM